MERHASMNRIYRLVWNAALNLWVAVAENAKGKSKGGSARSSVDCSSVHQGGGGDGNGGGSGFTLNAACKAAVGVLASFVFLAHQAGAADAVNASVVAGAGTVATTGNTTTINQSSQNLAIDWTSLSTRANEALVFNQPNASAVALNRITGSSPSELLGSLTANGQVFILNPNGVLFGAGSQVNVGGLVASTLSMSNADFMAGNHVFSNNGSSGSVVNQGTMTAASGGYLALLAPEVRNEGVMTASLGTALLAAGNKVTLHLANGSLLGYSIDQGAINALAENKQLIQANGGQVLLSAKAMDSLTTATVNNSGVIEAKTIQNKAGRILLMGDMEFGTVNVGGTLDASAPTGGDGGFIETSAAHVKVADSARVTTLAPAGNTGKWLIDPSDFVVAAAGGDMSGAALSAALAGTDVELQSTAGASAGGGDVNINDAVSWSANRLTLTAERDVNINAVMAATGSASLAMNTGATGNVNVARTNSAFTGRVDLDTSGTLAINGENYTIIRTLGTPDSLTGTDLQGMAGNLNGRYVMGADIVVGAAAANNWYRGGDGDALLGSGLLPIGTSTTPFTGKFEGLGHVLIDPVLAMYNGPLANVGVFGATGAASRISNVGVALTGRIMLEGAFNYSDPYLSNVGWLVGLNQGEVRNAYVSGTFTYRFDDHSMYAHNMGGLVGNNDTTGRITRSRADLANPYPPGVGLPSFDGVAENFGGLVGLNTGSITESSAAVQLSLDATGIGGLVGASSGTITDSFTSGQIYSGGGTSIGGLLGVALAGAVVDRSHSSVNVPEYNTYAGGLVGSIHQNAVLRNSWATGTVGSTGIAAYAYAGGLVGGNSGVVTDSYATGDVWGVASLGGLIGWASGTVSNSHATGKVTATRSGSAPVPSNGGIGGLVGVLDGGEVTDSWASGNVTSIAGDNNLGGLIGFAGMDIGSTTPAGTTVITGSHATGNVTRVGASSAGSGGFVGNAFLVGSWSNNYATGNVSAEGANSSVGGFAGYIYSSGGITDSYATGNVSAPTAQYVGGFGGSVFSFGGDGARLFSTGTVTGGDQVGGFAARMANIRDSYATGNVTANGFACGFSCRVTGNLINSYAMGGVSSLTPGQNYGFMALSPDATPSGNYYNATANPGVTVIGATGKTAAELQQASTFAGWDLSASGGSSAVWRIYEGQTTPLLRSFLTPMTLSGAPDLSLTYNGTTQSAGAAAVADPRVLGAAASGRNAGMYSGYYSSQLGYDLSGGNLTITPAGMVLTSADVVKTYDGTTAASGALAMAAGTLFGTDTSSGGSFAFTDKNAGAGNKTVTTAGVTVNDGNGGRNYSVSYVDNTSSTINKADLTVMATGASKSYDGTTAAAGTALVGTLAGAVAGEGVDAGGSQAFLDKNAGSGNKAVRASGVTIKDSGNADVTGNYNIAYVDNTSSTINKAGVTLSTSDVTKTYDGTTGAAGAVVLTGGTVFAGDTITGGAFAFADKNAGTGNKTVQTSGVTVGDGLNNANYNVSYADNTTSTINQASLTLSAGNVTKTYDGNTTAAGSATVTGGTLFGGDSLTGGNFAFTDRNAGNGNKTVTAAGVTVGDGMNSGNYAVTYANNTTSTINPFAVSVAGTRTYDGTAGMAAGALTIGPLVGSETLGLSGTATFVDKNVGANKALTVTGLGLNDGSGLASNYTFTGGTQQASVTQASLTVGTGNITRTYDGTTTAAGTAVVTGGTLFAGDNLSGGTFAFTDKNAGTGKTVNVSGVTVADGNGGGNYAVTYASNTSSSTTQASLTVTASGVNKVYDGTTGAAVAYGDNRVAGDVLGIAGAASFADKDAGTAKAVGASGIAVSGTDAGNYNLLNNTATTTADITPRALTVAVNNDAKPSGTPYSGGNGVTYRGLVAGETAAMVLTGGVVYGGNAQGAFLAGDYDITVGGLLANANYSLGFVAGRLILGGGDAASSALGGSMLTGAYQASLTTLGGPGLLPNVSVDDGKGKGGDGDSAAATLNAAAAEAAGQGGGE